MGVYIKDMEMPPNCASCVFVMKCKALSRWMSPDTALKFMRQRHSKCPLIETEVVMCKDCKQYLNEHICMYFSRHGTIETSSYAYCSYGERREP